MGESYRTYPYMTLREQIKKDFGHDLNIGEGSLTRDNPMPLLDDKPRDAAHTERMFVRDINIAKRKLWKINKRRLVDHEDKTLIELNLDTVEFDFKEEKAITENVGYYFLPVRKALGHIATINLPDDDAFGLPYSIGWFHYDGLQVNDDELGTTYFFNNLYSKMSIYIYDLGLKDIIDGPSPTLEQHAMNVISEIKFLNQSYESQGGIYKDDVVLVQEFFNEDEYSAVLLGAVNGKFIKVRITGKRWPKMLEIYREVLMGIKSDLNHYIEYNKKYKNH